MVYVVEFEFGLHHVSHFLLSCVCYRLWQV